jgi:glycosyltransferase involved in cell wall biosynthesis
MNIVTLSTADIAGGAEKGGWSLFQQYRQRGHLSKMVVGLKRSEDSDVLALPLEDQSNPWRVVEDRLAPFISRLPGSRYFTRMLHFLANPARRLALELGHEDFESPLSHKLLEIFPDRPDILHCHNLHGGWLPARRYFDLRALSALSHRVPVVLTLHDAWLLSGHCAHSFECNRWQSGCGQCPDLRIYPAVKRDGTAYNWRRKQGIYQKSRLYVAAPSEWLMRKVEQSMLMPGIVERRVIPYGIDLAVFQPPTNRAQVRGRLGLPENAKLLLSAATNIKHNRWKDYETMRSALELISSRLQDEIIFLALGHEAPEERIGNIRIKFIPFQTDPQVVAAYYQAADIYLHAARVDTFPNTVLEALACGTPVIATQVGGIPEQVKSLPSADAATGILVPPRDAAQMADGIELLLTQEELRHKLAINAAKDARTRFDLNREVSSYLEWYQTILDR